ncbi:sensor histidine kinase [Subsaximicrobium wynnwilliamsii]|uniref:hypothetical protein n=1 Tax=Subsaximicrobium wynnwilliamsii TaxID=291179 RepID=UPI0016718B5A|nr:hypothetical protein [Subsaximicrobium wynnwilliamsii]
MTITLTDEGKGFDLNTAEMENGIANMNKRAQEINADLKLTTQIGQGTVVHLNLKQQG